MQISKQFDSISTDAALRAACDMMTAGRERNHDTPLVPLALSFAMLSANNLLERNGLQALALREYVMSHGGKLPDSEQSVKALFPATLKPTATQARGIAEIQAAWESGALDPLLHAPRGLQAWSLWRLAVANLFGMGYKTASFAALLAWPLESPLIPIDRIVIRRLVALGRVPHDESFYSRAISGDSDRALRLYRSLERIVKREYREHVPFAQRRYIPPAIFHWAVWADYREHVVYQRAVDNSHVNLSAYWY